MTTTDGDALLAAIARFPAERDPKLRYIDWALENEEYTRSRIAATAIREPRLTDRELEYRANAPYFDSARLAILDAVRLAQSAGTSTGTATRTPSCARRLGSCPTISTRGADPRDRARGAFALWRPGPLIAAALDAGFKCDYLPGGTCAYLNVGDRLRPADKPKLPCPPRKIRNAMLAQYDPERHC